MKGIIVDVMINVKFEDLGPHDTVVYGRIK